MKAANRLHSVEEYYFSKKLREVRLLQRNGKPIINMGIGSPDLQPPDVITDALKNSVRQEGAHQYQSYQGLPELRKAISDFYRDKYSVLLNPENEVLPLMGSKEGIMHISMAFLNVGDEALIPNPGYPTYSSVTKLVGAIPRLYDLAAESNWLPNLDKLRNSDLSKVKIMWVNYPHMPTGAKATETFFEELIAFAREKNILLVNDNPYSFILNDNPLSLLKIKGAKEVALELNSLSKTFNLAGWRVGMVVGSEEHIQHILKVKSNMDSGMFYGIQQGAITALKSAPSWYRHLNGIYKKRRDLIFKIADELKCTYNKNAAGMFVWTRLPDEAGPSEEYIDKLLYEKDIFVTPGSVFGSNGESYIRFSLCVDEEKLKEALKRVSMNKEVIR